LVTLRLEIEIDMGQIARHLQGQRGLADLARAEQRHGRRKGELVS